MALVVVCGDGDDDDEDDDAAVLDAVGSCGSTRAGGATGAVEDGWDMSRLERSVFRESV